MSEVYKAGEFLGNVHHHSTPLTNKQAFSFTLTSELRLPRRF